MSKNWKRVLVTELSIRQRELVEQALQVQARAYAPYSNYKVGSAVLDSKGKIHTGCNVENASYSLVMCAERVAVAKMVSEGAQRIRAIALVALSPDPIFPCGACLQVIFEMGGPAVEVIAVDRSGTHACLVTMGELFPGAFTKEDLLGPGAPPPA